MMPRWPVTRGLAAAGVALALALVPGAAGAGAPERPRQTVDTAYPAQTGRSVHVPAGGDLQAALDAARPGDVITLEPQAVYTGPFTLPRKTGDAWIVVRTAVADARLPGGRRVDPSQASLMPILEAASGAVIRTAPGAHHYRFVGVRIRPRAGRFLYNLVDLGTGARRADDVPHHLVFDRIYLHGDPRAGARRGIAMNSAWTAVVDSHLADFKERGAEAQAIAGWGGPGPFAIVGNYLEGAGQNVMFGGGDDPAIAGLVPSDIEIRGNHFTKPLAWNHHHPRFAGARWTVKNLFQLKNARRVLVDGNVFEHNWVDAQAGAAILFTVRNQQGRAPWAVVSDVTFTNNVVRHAAAGLQILGRDNIHPSERTRRILVRNALFDDIGGERWGGNGRLFELYDGTADVVIEQVTAFQTGNVITAHGPSHQRFVFRNTIAPHNDYGVIGSGEGPGEPSLRAFFRGAVFAGNVLAGGPAAAYPKGNLFPPTLDAVGFLDRPGGDYRLGPRSRVRRAATDGSDPGADIEALNAVVAKVVQPRRQPPARAEGVRR
jgi:hypothetical protein